MKPPTATAASSPEGCLAALLAELETVAGKIPVEALPEFFAGLERARWASQVRFLGQYAPSDPGALRPLLTAEQVAGVLGVSVEQVYRMAKGKLRPAAVDVGEGTLRFDARAVERFIEARRR